jgi:peptide/nickel transport system permease protein
VTRIVATFIARRLGMALILAVAVSSGALLLGRLAPGDPADELRLRGADANEIAHVLRVSGFDRSIPSQLGHWVVGLARFDLGESSRFGRPVAPLVAERALNTLGLSGLALILATLIGFPLGVITGARPRGWTAVLVTPLSTALVACPPVVGALALLLVSVSTHWLSAAPGHIALPMLALALPLSAAIERLQSRATADTVAEMTVPAWAARGIGPSRWLWVHVARQASRPVLGVYGVIIAGLFSGSLAVETVTAWPGLGRLLYEALIARDLHLVAGCALAGALCIMAANVAADLLRLLVDPRLRDA